MTTESAIGKQTTAEAARQESLAQYTDRIALRTSWIVGIGLALLILLLNLGRNPIPMLEDYRSFGPLSLFFMVPARPPSRSGSGS
jgi:hypothetical protein